MSVSLGGVKVFIFIYAIPRYSSVKTAILDAAFE